MVASVGMQRFFQNGYGMVLLGFREKWMHGQADDFAGGFLRLGKVAPFIARGRKDRLFMEALWIIDCGWNALGFELFADGIAVGDANGVLGVNVGVAGHDLRDNTGGAKQFGIACADTAPFLNFPFEMWEFAQDDGGL